MADAPPAAPPQKVVPRLSGKRSFKKTSSASKLKGYLERIPVHDAKLGKVIAQLEAELVAVKKTREYFQQLGREIKETVKESEEERADGGDETADPAGGSGESGVISPPGPSSERPPEGNASAPSPGAGSSAGGQKPGGPSAGE